jgi:inosose dehydratase
MTLLDRVAGAPITWGVCEVPRWGFQLDRDRVLSEMSSLGLHATERGPAGFLPAEPRAAAQVLQRYGLTLVGGFVPAVLHLQDRLDHELGHVRRGAEMLAENGASVLVLAADTAGHGYERSTQLSASDWDRLVEGIERAIEVAGVRGLTVALHPHHGTVIDGPDDVDELLDRSSVSLCLDTGHLMVGGVDPLAVARSTRERIAHVHLKDVDRGLAQQVREGRVGYHEAVRRGMYLPLGRGDADIAGIVAALERAGYDGWYVLEQDTVLPERPPEGEGPLGIAAQSMGFLRGLAPGPDRGEAAGGTAGEGRSLQWRRPGAKEEVGR